MVETKLLQFDLNNFDHVRWLYEVRTHPQVAIHFFAPPPATVIDHIRFLAKTIASQERQFFIVCTNDQMCGYCQIINLPDSLEVGFAIHPDWQGKGIGSASIELLLKYIRLNSLSKSPHITLVVKNDNERAVNLYKKYGFTALSESNGQIKMIKS